MAACGLIAAVPASAGAAGGPAPVAHWALDEGSGTTAADSADGYTATLVGGAGWTGGIRGPSALQTNGSTAFADTSTTWGARRAADGHPKPFDLHYVEIGNEDFFDSSGSYEWRFADMYDAIEERYPQLKRA